MTLLNNATTLLSNMFAGFRNGSFNFHNAPYENSKMTKVIWALLQSINTQRLNIGFITSIWPTEPLYNEVMHTLNYLGRFTKLDD